MEMWKQYAKEVLPVSTLKAYDDAVDRLLLVKEPRKSFPDRKLGTIPLEKIMDAFRSSENARMWQADNNRIATYYDADDERLGLGISPLCRRVIYYLTMTLEPESVLEVGTNVGASTIWIAAALGRLDVRGTVTTVDIDDVNHADHGAWRSANMPRTPADCAVQLGLSDRIEFHRSDSREFMKAEGRGFDFIFLDGDHSARMVYSEVSLALSILNAGGLILLHDYYPDAKPLRPGGGVIKGPYRALTRISRENPLIDVLPFGALPWPANKGTTVTSLALVRKSPATN
jgi:predicted O-methyltransferase YrrM